MLLNRLLMSPKPGKLVDVNLTIDVTHSYIGDLEIALVNPGRTMVELIEQKRL